MPYLAACMYPRHPVCEKFLPGADLKNLIEALQRHALRLGLEESADDDGEEGAGAEEEVRS